MLYLVATKEEYREEMLRVNAIHISEKEYDGFLVWKLFNHHSVVDHIPTLWVTLVNDLNRIDEALDSIKHLEIVNLDDAKINYRKEDSVNGQTK